MTRAVFGTAVVVAVLNPWLVLAIALATLVVLFWLIGEVDHRLRRRRRVKDELRAMRRRALGERERW